MSTSLQILKPYINISLSLDVDSFLEYIDLFFYFVIPSNYFLNRKYEANKCGKQFFKTNNIIKLEKKIKLLHRKLSNIRNNHIHQATNKIVKLYPYRVVMEDLNIKGMMKNKHLSKAIQDQCLYEFIRQMKYKCEFNCIEFIQVNRFFLSSKKCSCCGEIKKDLKLKDRVFKCEYCNLVIDRDKNASINLGNYELV